LRAGLFDEDAICALPIVGAAFAKVDAAYPGLEPIRRRHEALRRVFGVMVSDVIDTSTALLQASGAKNVADIRHYGAPVVRFSDGLWQDLKVIREFLFTRMYRAPSVVKMREEVTVVVHDLFPLFLSNPMLLPERWHEDLKNCETETAVARKVSDYISGMTDRFALQEHARLMGK
jgi:dGTPase